METVPAGGPQVCPSCGSDDIEIVLTGNKSDMFKLAGIKPGRLTNSTATVRCKKCGRSSSGNLAK